MSFISDISDALADKGFEATLDEDILYVPLDAELEVQFHALSTSRLGAEVYVAASDAEEELDGDAILVSVVFTVEDAVSRVIQQVATEQVITVLGDLIEGTDERIADLEFIQDVEDPTLVWCEVAELSEIRVRVEIIEDTPTATVYFVAGGIDEEAYQEAFEEAVNDLWDSVDPESGRPDPSKNEALQALTDDYESSFEEELELGEYTDFDLLFEVIAVAADHANEWEAQLLPGIDDEYDDYDDDDYEEFDEDDYDDDDDDVEDDDDLDDDDDAEDEDDDEDSDDPENVVDAVKADLGASAQEIAKDDAAEID